MKYNSNKFITILVFLFIFTVMIILLFTSPKLFSENENRYLETRPSFSLSKLFNGRYIKSVENYLSDQFPYRDLFVGIKTSTDKFIGKTDTNGVYICSDGYLIEEYKKPMNSDRIIKRLNNFYESMNYINMNLMLVPTSISINESLIPKNAPINNQKNELDYIYNNINFDTIKVYDTLLTSNKVYQMFYRLDHHWTTYAAYYAYVEFAKANSIDYLSLNSFNIDEVTTDFKGTLYSKSHDYSKESDSIFLFRRDNEDLEVDYVYEKKQTETLYEMSYLDKKDKYSLFLDNNHPLIIITNNNIKINTELLIIKDSYANSIIPFLTNHYKKIHVIDPRFYKLKISDYIKENKIQDLLILYNMNTMDSDTGILSIN